MPRARREDEPGAVHHAMIRGVDGRAIFEGNEDRWSLVEGLSTVLPDGGMECLAWAFLTNHAHFVLRTGSAPLSAVMHRLNTRHARRFNDRLQRRGYVFQDRFRSRRVQGSGDLKNLIRYVHLNPLRAGLVRHLAELERYQWCSYGGTLGRRRSLPFESSQRALAEFDEDRAAAVAALRSFMRAQADDGDWQPWATPPSQPPRPEAAEVVSQICRRLGVDPADIAGSSKVRRVAAMRAAVCFIAVRQGVRRSELALALGVQPSTITRSMVRGRRIAAGRGLRDSGR